MAQNRVGINTDTPFLDLDVRGTDDVWDGGELQLATPSMSHFIRMFGGREGDKNPFLAFRDIDTFHFVTSSPDWQTFTRRMTIDPIGRIGIGVTSPLAGLHINIDGNSTELLRFNTTNAWVFQRVSNGLGLALKTLSNNRTFQVLSSNGLNRAAFITVHDTYSKVSLVPDGGEVGIGIQEANAKLHVRADGTSADPQLRLTETTQNDYVTIKFENSNEPALFWDIRATTNVSPSNSLLRFYHNASGNPATEKLTITGEGKVGVGLALPSAKLDVAGKIKVTDDADAPAAGMIRYNASTQDFEGYDGVTWLSLTKNNREIEWGNPLYTSTESQKRLDNTGGQEHFFGFSSSVSNNQAVAGAPFRNFEKGKVVTFRYQNNFWDTGVSLTNPAGQDGDRFGWSVDIDGDYIIVGAPKEDVGGNMNQGRVYIFFWNGSAWVQQAAISAPAGNASDDFGFSVSISGNRILVGAPGADVGGSSNKGKAAIFERTGSTWTHMTDMTSGSAAMGSQFGYAVSLDGNVAVIGGPEGINEFASVYEYSGFAWAETELLSNGSSGQYGRAVSVSGNYIVVGAAGDNVAFVYERSGGTWNILDTLYTSVQTESGSFGSTVDINGNYIVIGSPHAHVEYDFQGEVYLYKKIGTHFELVAQLQSSQKEVNRTVGKSVGIADSHIIVGSPGFSDNGANPNRGEVLFYKKN